MSKISFALGAWALWLVPSVGQLGKYLGLSGTVIVTAAAMAAINLLFKWFDLTSITRSNEIAARLIPPLGLFTIVIFAVLYPLSKSGIVGPGSDRDNALDIALVELLHGSYPYYARTYLGNTLTPAPGAMLLALPFFLLGTSALQNLFWLPIFLWFSARRLFCEPRLALVFYSIFLLACPGAMQDFVTGGDYLINAIYVGVAVSLVTWVHEAPHPRLTRLLVCAFLAAAVSSRFIYGVAIPILAIFVGQRCGVRSALKFAIITAMLVLAINLPFYVYDPANFAPMTLGRKLEVIPSLHAALILPIVSILIASLSICVRLDQTKIFSTLALALVPVFVTPIIFTLSMGGWTDWTTLNYFLPISIYGGVAVILKLGTSFAGGVMTTERNCRSGSTSQPS